MVECSPATRAARVRFPANANIFLDFDELSNHSIIRMGTRNREGRELVELVMRNGLTVAGSFGWEQRIERIESWKNWL